ncbi:MAG: cobalamin biosynthesis protein CobD [Nitrospira sp.]|nr:cobalamin biosynthesis protein CobD [Nitrospira sp.]MBH0181718.1 cobalamin biosynthesis protein CobD [Nitrospira sp.]MBH0186331.1 cobalamin biosynthesis protein CobD [Nitrospira sp.]
MTGSELLLAAGVDAVVGDPRWLPHPVRVMGRGIAWCDEHVRLICRGPRGLRMAGLCLALGLPSCVYVAGLAMIEAAGSLSGWFGTAVSILLASTTLAGRDLWDHTQAVRTYLQQGNLRGARLAVAMIVGRDTEQLSESDITRATVETVAESTSDGIIAPLFYLAIGGAPLALAYKAVNTLDSMIGHRDARYIDFGWASAKLDDAANWVPARLTALLLILAAGLLSGKVDRMHQGWRMLVRDGGKHPSPNSGRPEAAMAGVLGVRLGGRNSYDGVSHERPFLGEGLRSVAVEDATIAMRIMALTFLLGVLTAAGCLWFV